MLRVTPACQTSRVCSALVAPPRAAGASRGHPEREREIESSPPRLHHASLLCRAGTHSSPPSRLHRRHYPPAGPRPDREFCVDVANYIPPTAALSKLEQWHEKGRARFCSALKRRSRRSGQKAVVSLHHKAPNNMRLAAALSGTERTTRKKSPGRGLDRGGGQRGMFLNMLYISQMN